MDLERQQQHQMSLSRSNSTSLSRKPSRSNRISLGRQASADEVFAQLITMGFDIEQSTSAVRVSLAQAAQGHQGVNLLEAALQYLLATSDSETRAVLYSSPPSPKSSTPPPLSSQPVKGILKPSSSPPAIRSTTPSIFKRDWLAKQVDTATSVLSATLGRMRTQAAGVSAATSTSNNMIPSWTSLFGSPPSDIQVLNLALKSTNGHAMMSHTSSAGSLSTLSSSPSNPPSEPDTHTHSREITESHDHSLGKLPRHVRFSFPDITILPQNLPTDDVVYYADEAADTSSDMPGGLSHPMIPLTVNSTDSLARRHAGSSRNVDHSPIQGTRMRDATNRYDADELLLFYQQAASRRSEPILDKLANQLSISGYVTKLDLSGTMLDRKNVASIAELLTEVVGLRQLNLSNCNLDDENLKMLLHAILYRNELPWLSLSENRRLRGNGIKYIAVFIKKTKSLKYLDLSGLNIDRKGLAYINHALTPSDSQPIGPTLEVLKLESCRLKGTILDTLIPGVRRSRLTHLSLRDNKATWEAGQHIADMLISDDDVSPDAGTVTGNASVRKGLSSLDLRGNELRNGIAPICAALNENDTLRELDLRDNKIDGPALDIIASMLRKNAGLRVLDLSGNSLGTDLEGITSLKEAMTQNHDLVELYLANTRIGTEGAIALAEALPLCSKLQRLDVTYNPIDLAGVLGLAISLKHNKSLISLDIVPVLDKPGIKAGEEEAELQRLLSDIREATNRNMELLATRPSQITTADSQGSDKVPESRNVFLADSHSVPTVGTPPRTVNSQHRRSVIDPLQSGREISAGEETAGVLIDMIKQYNDTHTPDNVNQDELMRQLYVECQRLQDRLHSLLNGVVDEALTNQILVINDKLLEAMRAYETDVGVRSPPSPRKKHEIRDETPGSGAADGAIPIPSRGSSAPSHGSSKQSQERQNGGVPHSEYGEEVADVNDADSVISESSSDLGTSPTIDTPIGKAALELTFSDPDFASLMEGMSGSHSRSGTETMRDIESFLKENGVSD
ncbi:hypothetical protein SeLEV6574_g01189 [Synchytrium endobioticum]|uniref:GAT domain-containing protein n=1 Tax=Synchytrium endobioticum TaxID=286115 RepID=A0A507DGE4_9FUNG|nr:hypothetical protein SeLEV6574_g01189 [Synchytrium endobioticum]